MNVRIMEFFLAGMRRSSVWPSKIDLAATDYRDATRDELFSLFSGLPTASGYHFLREAETSECPAG
jgi:hypothetical protein